MAKYLLLLLAVLTFASPGFSADKKAAKKGVQKKAADVKTPEVETPQAKTPDKKPFLLTQKDLGRLIVTRFGWDKGLPVEPTDRDYLLILNGRRTFRFEAEDVYNPKTDRVSVAKHNLHGKFTGIGWLQGVSETTTANFSVLIPVAGDYNLKAVLHGKGFVWNVAGTTLQGGTSSGGFTDVDCGPVKLQAGKLLIKLMIPPGGSIDSFSLVAPSYVPVQPFAGWRFKEPLTAERLAEVVVSLTNNYSQLPPVAKGEGAVAPVAAVDAALATPDASSTVVSYLGRFSSRAWLRASYRGAELKIPLRVKEAGVYALRARVLGAPIVGDINGTSFLVGGKPYLDAIDFGDYLFDQGENMLTVRLPSMGGIDTIELTRRSTAPEDVMRIAGVTGPAGRQISSDEADKFINSVKEKFPVRK